MNREKGWEGEKVAWSQLVPCAKWKSSSGIFEWRIRGFLLLWRKRLCLETRWSRAAWRATTTLVASILNIRRDDPWKRSGALQSPPALDTPRGDQMVLACNSSNIIDVLLVWITSIIGRDDRAINARTRIALFPIRRTNVCRANPFFPPPFLFLYSAKWNNSSRFLFFFFSLRLGRFSIFREKGTAANRNTNLRCIYSPWTTGNDIPERVIVLARPIQILPFIQTYRACN